ncbi:hypothetical protein P8C59_005489 [Phyllachora maydis]|uniref:ATP-dependent RNA helicase n=1 Tax=Phyllachora maydis TaxID=1825666 RepID=A0AAD9I676_9PEZI|nr:hypothetical protein P8C59_005489 [Phyllachora maydis]
MEWYGVVAKGFSSPTPVQHATLPIFRSHKDVVVEAVTGSGKTLAYMIPVIEKMLRAEDAPRRHHVQGIVCAPTRELAQQIYDVTRELISFHAESRELFVYANNGEKRPESASRVVVPQLLVGGTTKAMQDLSQFLSLSPNLLIATPGRLAELLASAHCKTPASSFEVLVLDEADRLLDLGFSQALSTLLSFLPKQRRTGLFSASMSDAVQELIKVGMLYPHKITVRVRSSKGGLIEERKTPLALQMSYVRVPASKKLPMLCRLLETLQPQPNKSICFASTCFAVKYWHQVLPALLPSGVALMPLHGKLEPKVRIRNFERFVRSSGPAVLLATDVAARGLDIPAVDLVLQLDPPQDVSVFVHRCGRAGRAVNLLEDPPMGVSDEEAEEASAKLRAQAQADRSVYELGKTAFVSWVRSYSKNTAGSIFRVSDLDWRDLAQGWGLLELPKMPELRKLDVDRSLGLGIDTESIAFLDKKREKKRQIELAEWKEAKTHRAESEPQVRSGRKKNEAWSAKHDREEVKAARREKKRRKREAEKTSRMSEAERQEHQKLEQLVDQVRRRNEAAARASTLGDADFEGFSD